MHTAACAGTRHTHPESSYDKMDTNSSSHSGVQDRVLGTFEIASSGPSAILCVRRFPHRQSLSSIPYSVLFLTSRPCLFPGSCRASRNPTASTANAYSRGKRYVRTDLGGSFLCEWIGEAGAALEFFALECSIPTPLRCQMDWSRLEWTKSSPTAGQQTRKEKLQSRHLHQRWHQHHRYQHANQHNR